MGPGYFVLALLGCDDSALMCDTARVVEVQYRTAAECNAAINTQLEANTDLAYPVLMGRCDPAGVQVAERKKNRPG